MELSKNVIKFVMGVTLTILGFVLSNNLYFKANPLFGTPFFGQTLIAFAFGAFGVLVLPVLTFTIVKWFENVIAKTAMKSLSEFFDTQAKKSAESKKKKEEEKEKRMLEERPVVLDTSAIIDGRIVDVVKTGFLDNTLIVPKVVLEELQLIADSSDTLKRQRGRRGLDIVRDIKKITKVTIWEAPEEDGGAKSLGEDVDKALIKIAKKLNASIATVDFNLNKVASVTGIKVLNVNELSNAIRAVALPGEELTIKVVQLGKEASQGVGYLEDGTMVVIENGSDLVGKTATVTIHRVIQSPAGKMLFARK